MHSKGFSINSIEYLAIHQLLFCSELLRGSDFQLNIEDWIAGGIIAVNIDYGKKTKEIQTMCFG
jgi:hypothetical protein